MENSVTQALRTRRSIRHFKPQQISDEELRTVLEAGTWAPTGKGRQDPWIVAVQNPELMTRISRLNARIWGRADIDPFYGAPTYILVFGSQPEVWGNSICDGTLVLGNMMIAAHSIGLGSCWINRERELFATEEGRAMMEEMGLPEGLIGVGALALGYPDGEPTAPRARKENYFRIIR